MKDFLLHQKKHIKKQLLFYLKYFQKTIHALSFSMLFPIIAISSTLILFSILLLYTIDSSIRRQIISEKLQILPIHKPFITDYPILQTVLTANSLEQMNMQMSLISAEALVIMDDTSKVLLYQRNAHLRFSLASTTKIMTAIVGLEHYKLDDILYIANDTVEGSVIGLKKGEQITFKNVLYGMLLPSGNDAALAIAQNYPGGENAFVSEMNRKAQEYHLTNTHFSDSIGLADEGDYSTPSHLALLCSLSMQNDLFPQLVRTKQIIISDVTGTQTYNIANLNKLLGNED